LTQANKRQAKGSGPIPLAKAASDPENICRSCGASVSNGRKHCAECEEERVRARMVEVAKAGRIAAQAVEPRTRMAATQRKHALARFAWKESDLPAWLTEETYRTKIQPLLKSIANPVIMSALGVSVTYAVAIRAGRRRPHPRHWKTLARLVDVQTVTST
jgi:transketolase